MLLVLRVTNLGIESPLTDWKMYAVIASRKYQLKVEPWEITNLRDSGGQTTQFVADASIVEQTLQPVGKGLVTGYLVERET